jgi:HK97 family phage prohead protease
MTQLRRVALAAALASTCLLTRDAAIDDDERRQPMVDDSVGRRDFMNDAQVRFAPNSYDATARTIDAVISTGAQVKRFFFTEELEISPDAIDLGRATTGMVPLLDSHNQGTTAAVLGTVSNVRIEGGQLIASLKFGETDQAKLVEGMVARGELKGISIGYRVQTWTIVSVEDGSETWRATRWELLEVSIVSVPADANAVVRAAPGQPSHGTGATAATKEEENDMRRNLPGGASAAAIAAATVAADDAARAAAPAAPAPNADDAARAVAAAAPAPAPAPAAPQFQRFSAVEAIAFIDQARAFGETVVTRANELVQQNEAGQVGVETARAALLQAAAEAQRAQTAPARGGPSATILRDGEETSRNAIVDAIVARATRSDPSEAGREYMGMRLLEIAAMRAGIDPRRERDATVILRAANTTSDFPKLLEAAANKVMLARYNTALPTYRAIAARRDLTDFKTTKLLRVGDFPTLLPYQEDGEIASGTINEGRETVILGSFGRILRLSRQAIVNDDLGAFDQVLGSIGTVVSRFENSTFWAMKAANSGNGPKLADNVNFFNSAHGNLAASGAAPDATTLGAARAAMRVQKDLDGNALNLSPKIILTGAAIETDVEKLLAPIQAVQITNVNPFAGKLMQVTEAQITGNSWELYADPAELAAFNYGYLADAPGPRILSEEPFSVDGMAFRVTLDFYAGAVDFRGGFRNPGA